MEKTYPLGTKENFEIIQWVLDPKVIDGALRSAIHAHGPITLGSQKLKILEQDDNGFWSVYDVHTCSTSSAAKRIRGAVRTRVVEYLQKKSEKPPKVWYTRIIAPFLDWTGRG